MNKNHLIENFFHFQSRLSHGHLNSWKLRNQWIFELQKSKIYRWKVLEKFYSLVKFSEAMTEFISIKNLKLTSNMVYGIEKFLKLVDCYISIKRSWKTLFNSIVLENVDWSFCHQKSQTWFLSLKIFVLIMTYFVPLKGSWKVLFNGNKFENNQFSHFFKLLVNHPSTTCKLKTFKYISTMRFYIFWILR